MVKFEKKRLLVEIECHDSAEMWVDTMRALLDLISIADKSMLDNKEDSLYGLCFLMRELLPDVQTAQGMYSEGK